MYMIKNKPQKVKAIFKNINDLDYYSSIAIVMQIATALNLKVSEDNMGISAYGNNNDTFIRLSDHCTYLQTWVDSGSYRYKNKYDIVIEENPTMAKTNVANGYNFNVFEYVKSVKDMDFNMVKTLAYDIKTTLNGNPYPNNIRGEKRVLMANTNQQQMESHDKLSDIITETINKVLKTIMWKREK